MVETKILLLSTKTYRSDRKDSRDEWVVMTDAITGEESKKHYSLSSFNQEGKFYTLFFKHNNEIARNLVKVGYDAGELYTKFFETGLRVSQQLDGQVRERTMEEYNRLKKGLSESLLSYAKESAKEKRDKDLGSLVEQTPEKYRKDVSLIVEQLKQKEMDFCKRKPQRGYALDDMVNTIIKEENKELAKYFPLVDDFLKAKFLSVIKYTQLNDEEGDWFRDGNSVDEVYKIMKETGVENSDRYLDILLGLLEESDIDSLHMWTWKASDEYIKEFDSKQKELYFEVLGRTLKEDMMEWNVFIAVNAAKLLPLYGSKKAEAMINEVFTLHKDCEEDIYNYLDFKIRDKK